MLTTRQKLWRHYWYATVRIADLADGPKPFTLMGERIVVFLDGEGEPAALMDRCCHRTAKLSIGGNRPGRTPAITAGPTTAPVRSPASRSSRPSRWCRGSP